MRSEYESSRGQAFASGILRILAAIVLGQTLYFKFSGAEESIHIFSRLGVEPWGRFLTGALEAIAVALLLVPRTAALGGLMAAGLMTGAILSHLGPLGIEVQGDGGLLFGLACAVWVAGAVVAFLRRKQLPVLGKYFGAATGSTA